MTEWASMQDGYGSAENVPALLARAAKAGSDDHALSDELWGRLCHQGTVYGASYAALPALAQMSVQHEPSGYVAALHLAAAIIASNDGPDDRAVVRRRYEREVADLLAVATRNLQYARDDTYFVYGLQALMAFEDGGVWQSTTVTPLEPPASTVEGRLLALAQSNGRTAVAIKLPYLFGASTCPDCHEPFEIPPAFA